MVNSGFEKVLPFLVEDIVTKASLLAGVGLALAMYCRETGRSSRDFHAELVLGPPVWE